MISFPISLGLGTEEVDFILLNRFDNCVVVFPFFINIIKDQFAKKIKPPLE